MKKIVLIFISLSLCYCVKDDLPNESEDIKNRITALTTSVADINLNIQNLHKIMDETVILIGLTQSSTTYVVDLSDGSKCTLALANEINGLVPLVGIDLNGYWILSLDNGGNFKRLKDTEDKDIPAYPSLAPEQESRISPKLKLDTEGNWLISYDGTVTWTNILDDNGENVNGVADNTIVSLSSFFKDIQYDATAKTLSLTLQTEQEIKFNIDDSFSLRIEAKGVQDFLINDTRVFKISSFGVVSTTVNAPEGWSAELSETELTITSPTTYQPPYEDKILINITSAKNHSKAVILNIRLNKIYIDPNAPQSWKDFVLGSDSNVLLDFSFAGYKHGEEGPPEASTLGYQTFNITSYGAIADDEISDRQAFIDAVAAAKANGSGIIYFPAGRFILHDDTDNTGDQSSSIFIHTGNIVIKGAGRDLSTIVMKTPNLPTDPAIMYSSPVMINIKHNAGLSDITAVTGNAKKGEFSLEVASTAGINVGDWVCLYLKNNDPELVAEEIAPYTALSTMTNLVDEGVQVTDYHQIAGKSGNRITFKEPIMRAVDPKWGWKICKYPHYENVGVEDLTFEGNAKEDFVHHGSWQDDGAYKPINLMRLTNSWMRRVRFRNISEASSIVSSANVSVYDIKIEGRRGHAAIRSQGSSRVFIGKVVESTSGQLEEGGYAEATGQFHACGVSKTSMGAVLWNINWGMDGTFESHASQPRATLVDNCTGALLRPRAGGAADQLPNHLADLTLWNLNSKITSHSTNFIWWEDASTSWKFLPPIIIGYHGATVTFDQTQVIRDESHGTKVYPESLYEAQLELRLGHVPAWLTNLK